MSQARSISLRIHAASPAREQPVDRTAEMDLLRRVQAGDQDAFAEVVQKHWKRAFWTAYDVVFDHDRAQDIAQEAFVKVHRAIHTYDLGRDFASWLYRIVLNLGIDHKRRMDRDKSIPTDKVEELVDAKKVKIEDEEKASTIERVELILSSLSEKYRIPLKMKDIDGMSVEEIARILDVTYSTVRWRLHKARSFFRERWVRRIRQENRETP